MSTYQSGRPQASNSDAYGLRRHNGRVVNPETRVRSKTYYEVRYYARALTQLVVGLFWMSLFAGIFYFAYLVLASFYEG